MSPKPYPESYTYSQARHGTQEVLHQEQRALTEMDDTMMQRILKPVQCAVLIVDTFPAACVALPLAEAVASLSRGARCNQTLTSSWLCEAL